jgi:hypothetical protein
VAQAALGTLSAPNAGPVQVVVAGGAVAADTLVLLRAEAHPMSNSTRPCPAGGACLYLVGGFSGTISVGELLLVSAPALGARVYRVTAAPRDTRAACGADCEEEVACPTYQDVPTDRPVVVISSTMDTAGSAPPRVRAGIPCGQSVYSDGSVCTERRDTVGATETRREWSCSARGRVSAYTEVPVRELTTTAFRFPPAGTAPTQSGAYLTPRVRTQRVTASRFFTRREGARGAPVLVRQTGVDASGAWNAAVPVAGPVTSLEVETLHTGETEWRRGVGVDAATLAHDPSNTNYVYNAALLAGEPGFAFRRGYHDVGAVRIRFTVPSEQADGTVRQKSYVTLVATNGATQGGSEGGW